MLALSLFISSKISMFNETTFLVSEIQIHDKLGP